VNERTLRPGNIAAGALVLGGVLIVVLPQHALSIVRLAIVTVAAAAGLYALAVQAPSTWWMSPFDRRVRRERKSHGSNEMRWIRSRLAGPRKRIDDGPSLPADAVRLLQPLIRAGLEREGLDPADESYLASARGLLSPPTWAVLTHDPLERPRWFRTLWPDERATAEIVHSVLDDIDRLADSGVNPARHMFPSDPRAK
jgi:hypothetical protein